MECLLLNAATQSHSSFIIQSNWTKDYIKKEKQKTPRVSEEEV